MGGGAYCQAGVPVDKQPNSKASGARPVQTSPAQPSPVQSSLVQSSPLLTFKKIGNGRGCGRYERRLKISRSFSYSSDIFFRSQDNFPVEAPSSPVEASSSSNSPLISLVFRRHFHQLPFHNLKIPISSIAFCKSK